MFKEDLALNNQTKPNQTKPNQSNFRFRQSLFQTLGDLSLTGQNQR